MKELIDNVLAVVLVMAGFFVVFVMVASLMAWPFMWLWNYSVVAAVTVAKPLTYWPAFGLLAFLMMFIAGSRSSK